MSIEVRTAGGVAEVVLDFPPVNALPVRGWHELATAIAAGADSGTRAVILAAEGRGFCAGVDIKEMQRTPGYEALLGASQGCFAAFAAVYECPVPVIAAVHGFCLGGGVGLAGNADVVIAAEEDGNREPNGTAPAGRPEASAGSTEREPEDAAPSGLRSRFSATREDGTPQRPEASAGSTA